MRLLTGPGPEIHRAQSDEVALCSLQLLCLLLSVLLLIDLALYAVGRPWAPVAGRTQLVAFRGGHGVGRAFRALPEKFNL